MRRTFLAILVLTISLSGCSKQTTAPAAVPPPPVPELVATNPPARTAQALYDTPIWAEFDRSLDRHSVTPQNVYLKLDGQRTPITVSYDDTTHRVTLRPTVTLQLLRTYTVEFSTSVKGADGTPLSPGVFFQFTTNGLRRPAYDYPLASALEGPLATLGWGGTQGPTDNITYEVYASTDSLAVLNRTVPFLNRSVLTRFLPSVPWPMGSTVYWSLTSENLTTHERLDGSIRSFRTLDPATPLDSVFITARDHGSRNITNTTQQCTATTFSCGPSFNGALHWGLSAIPADARIQSVSVRLTTNLGGGVAAAQPALWIAQNDWSNCLITAPGPPFNELTGFLSGSFAESNTVALFEAPRLGAFFEALVRSRTLIFGTLVRANSNIIFQSTLSGDPNGQPHGTIRFYHLPPGATP